MRTNYIRRAVAMQLTFHSSVSGVVPSLAVRLKVAHFVTALDRFSQRKLIGRYGTLRLLNSPNGPSLENTFVMSAKIFSFSTTGGACTRYPKVPYSIS